MTNQELAALLKRYPDDATVRIAAQYGGAPCDIAAVQFEERLPNPQAPTEGAVDAVVILLAAYEHLS